MTNSKMVLVSIALIVATGIMGSSPSTLIGYAQAQMYDNQYRHDSNYYRDDNNRYSYDKKETSPQTDVQKINCGNSNINVNGVDITQIPTDDLATTEAANDGGSDATGANTQNGNTAGNKINFDRNLINVCVNSNGNEQVKTSPPGTIFLNTANVYLIESTVHLEPNIFSYREALCDDGDFVLNGGYFLRQSGIIGDEQVSLDRPITGPSEFSNREPGSGWAVQGGVIGGEGSEFTVSAFCFDNPPVHIP